MTTDHSTDYYQILSVSPHADRATIKAQYQKLILVHHPDKQTHPASDPDLAQAILRAWQVLGDERSRKRYDAWLTAQESSLSGQTVWKTVFLAELDRIEAEGTYPGQWSLGCRCGDRFAFSDEDLRHIEEDQLTIECDSCSLVLVVWLWGEQQHR
ncbi:hypothetical protein TCAL_03589 [Tigriopus californicus]|uniref:Diphthamide biosynthesis protein 4 n=1 Tax=Tigriopus californicus TaxID=6832 RepID=A0A553NFB2_TIGCA|nr:dnaJ homolog subfamily C member 24-like [Tigriopus californicus]TRY64137.1 hypothetical protein TCAL_03589 [Tigriopus californicus]|eukprot:TCALIF_03589-PA protein Name:"Similar to DNAJC24 DnaJ homolog subfamily C member 24 (Bos taurus)" AED:0.09 eAED:0.09 QI:0/-1/0/1/-1/1/1/0/154